MVDLFNSAVKDNPDYVVVVVVVSAVLQHKQRQRSASHTDLQSSYTSPMKFHFTFPQMLTPFS